MFLAGAIFLFTLVLVIWQPRGLSIGWSATIGAALALMSGVITLTISLWCGISSGMRRPRLSR